MPDRLEDLKAALAGRYDIDREVGQGGMATVYLAADVRHNRQVAVKVLRPDLAAALGTERFLREIEIAAQLTHPHILPLYDSGEADGFLYYVMPYIAGDTLRDRIDKEGELPIGETVRILREVTDALAFAHAQGVVHRDIKPDNVMLAGRHAMVTDFGVAKAVSEATGRHTLTTAGVALGTPTYMAPEQATADPHVDHRADIYAVGVMAYELLAGRTPFSGASPQAVLAAHVTEQAEPVSKHRDQVPADLETLVMRCLAKKPADRWQSAEEMLPLLESMATSSGGLTPTTTRPLQGIEAPRSRRVWWMALGAVAAVAVLAVFGARLMRDASLRVTVAGVRQVTHSALLELLPDISDDGREIVYTAGRGIDYHVYVRNVDGGPPLALTESRPGIQWTPRWTPDGSAVRFFEFEQTLLAGGATTWEMPKFGGEARQVSTGLGLESATVATRYVGDTLEVRAMATGEIVARVAMEPAAAYTVPSPDGTKVAYVRGNGQYYSPELLGNDVPTSIWVRRFDADSPVRVTGDAHLDIDPTWVGNDRLLFVSNRDGQRDIYLVQLRHDDTPAAEPVRVTTAADVHSVSVTPDGRTAAYARLSFRSNLHEITLPDEGVTTLAAARPLTREAAVIEQHDRSADGTVLVYDSNILGQQDIFLRPTAGGEPRRITDHPSQDMSPTFSPDGSEIAFYSIRDGSRDLYLIDVDGQNERRLTGDTAQGWRPDQQEIFPAFSPDGRHLAFMAGYVPLAYQLMVMSRDPASGDWGPARTVGDSAAPFYSWSEDGSYLVYQAAGIGEGLRRVTLAGQEKTVVDVGGLRNPLWPYIDAQGRLFFQAEGPGGRQAIYVTTEDGAPRMAVQLEGAPLVTSAFAMTVRGQSMVLVADEKDSDIYVMDLEY